jgi:hypothetical protein
VVRNVSPRCSTETKRNTAFWRKLVRVIPSPLITHRADIRRESAEQADVSFRS